MQKNEYDQLIIDSAVCVMIADKEIHDAEKNVISRILCELRDGSDEEMNTAIERVIERYRENPGGYVKDYWTRVAESELEVSRKARIIELMLKVAEADGTIHPNEVTFITRVADGLKISESIFDELTAAFSGFRRSSGSRTANQSDAGAASAADGTSPNEPAKTTAAEELLVEIEKRLPHSPLIVQKLLMVLSRKNANIDDLAGILEAEPAFVTKLLKYANRELEQAGKAKANNVHWASEVLGFERLKRVIISVSVFWVMDLKNKRLDFDIANFWKFSLGTAVAAKALCELNGVEKRDPDLGFVAGLLTNIGKLYLLITRGAKYENALGRVRERFVVSDSLEVERASVGVDHCEFGAIVARHYRFPPDVVAAVKEHHDYRHLGRRTLFSQIVIMARLISLLAYCKPDKYAAFAVKDVREKITTYLKIPHDKVDRLVDTLIREVRNLALDFEIDAGYTDPKFYKGLYALKKEIAQRSSDDRDYADFLARPAEFMPTSLAKLYLSFQHEPDPVMKAANAFHLADHLLCVLGYLGALQLKVSGLTSSKIFRNFWQKSAQPFTMGGWKAFLSEFFNYAGASPGIYLIPEFDRFSRFADDLTKIIELRNQLQHTSGKYLTKARYYKVLNEMEQRLDKAMSQCFLFYSGYFFFVVKAETRGGSRSYKIRRWQGPIEENIRPVHDIASDEELIEDERVYFHDERAGKIMDCSPWIIREISKTTFSHNIFLFKSGDQRTKRIRYSSPDTEEEIKRDMDESFLGSGSTIR